MWVAATYHHVPSGLRTTLHESDSPSILPSIFHHPGASLNSPHHVSKRFVRKLVADLSLDKEELQSVIRKNGWSS